MNEYFIPMADEIFSFLLIFLPLIFGVFHASFKGKNISETLLLYYIFIGVGLQALASGIAQTFFSNSVFQYVRWPFSPFMLELGLANISYGILGFLSPWMEKGWKKATAFGYALFLLFTGTRHALEIFNSGVNSGNSGAFAYVDYIMSAILFFLLTLCYNRKPLEKSRIP